MTSQARRRSNRARAIFAGAALLCAAAFVALGIWQVERRAWKHALIAAVEGRIHAAPVPAPGPSAWPGISADGDAYRHIRVTGRFRHDRETLVQAVTDLGSGYWVLTPLETPDFTLLVNRGFVPPHRKDRTTRADGNPSRAITVSGLLRVSEPGGGFLRANDPDNHRWYSRDVSAIAAAQGLGPTAPYFIDADSTANPGGFPVGGLTVLRFADNHMQYALTWFALALLSIAAACYVLRSPAPHRPLPA
ncbi:MAG: SURF1 family protein [Sphingobium sp.]